MHIAMRGAALALIGLVCVPLRAGSPAPPVTAFAVLPQVGRADLSPSGTLLAWVDGSSGDERINIYDIAAQKDMRALAVDSSVRIRWLEWSDDATLLYELSDSETLRAYHGPHTGPEIEREIYRLFAAGPADHGGRMMLGRSPDLVWNTALQVLRSRTSKPHSIVVQMYADDRQAGRLSTGTLIQSERRASSLVVTVYEVDTRTGEGSRIEVGDQFTYSWLVDKDGHVLARAQWIPGSRLFEILAKRGQSWSAVYEAQRDAPMPIAGLTGDQSAILVIDRDADGRTKAWSLPLDGSSRTVAMEHPGGDVTRIHFDQYTGAPVSFSATGPEPHLVWVDKDAEARFQSLTRSFPHLSVDTQAESRDHDMVVVRVDGPDNPPIHYLINRTTHRAEIIGLDFPGLKDVKLGQVTALSYRARDGTTIPAYLTLPYGAGNDPLPLVVLPHGGQGHRDSDSGFEWLRQFLASRGYAVFQPQFRGSSGVSDAFERAGDRQWGLLMQDDITDGVRALIDQGRVDPKRICILGYSYGPGYPGYAALAGAAFTPSLYKCAISVNGVSDLQKFIGYQNGKQGKESNNEAYWRQHLGEWSDTNIVAKSPARAAGGITAAVLLIYSTNDSVVPPAQSTLMADSLREAGKSVQTVELTGDDHGLSRNATRLRALQAIDEFLHDHL